MSELYVCSGGFILTYIVTQNNEKLNTSRVKSAIHISHVLIATISLFQLGSRAPYTFRSSMKLIVYELSACNISSSNFGLHLQLTNYASRSNGNVCSSCLGIPRDAIFD